MTRQGMIRNRPTPEGRELGRLIAGMTDKAMAEAQAAHPGQLPERCKTCAFRGGTEPNGCPTTVMDAFKSVMERTPFYCHSVTAEIADTEQGLCAGWAASVLALKGDGPLEMPWEFSEGRASDAD